MSSAARTTNVVIACCACDAVRPGTEKKGKKRWCDAKGANAEAVRQPTGDDACTTASSATTATRRPISIATIVAATMPHSTSVAPPSSSKNPEVGAVPARFRAESSMATNSSSERGSSGGGVGEAEGGGGVGGGGVGHSTGSGE